MTDTTLVRSDARQSDQLIYDAVVAAYINDISERRGSRSLATPRERRSTARASRTPADFNPYGELAQSATVARRGGDPLARKLTSAAAALVRLCDRPGGSERGAVQASG